MDPSLCVLKIEVFYIPERKRGGRALSLPFPKYTFKRTWKSPLENWVFSKFKCMTEVKELGIQYHEMSHTDHSTEVFFEKGCNHSRLHMILNLCWFLIYPDSGLGVVGFVCIELLIKMCVTMAEEPSSKKKKRTYLLRNYEIYKKRQKLQR